MKHFNPTNKIVIPVTGIHCASCVGRIEKALTKLEGVDNVTVNLVTKKAFISGNHPVESLYKAIESLGFGVKREPIIVDKDQETDKKGLADAVHKIHKNTADINEKQRLILSIILTVPILMISMFHIQFQFSTILQLLLTTVVIFWPGYEFAKTAFFQIKQLGLGMETLIITGTGTAYIYSFYNMLALKEGMIYFETASMIITLMLLGRHLESKATNRACEAIKKLMEANPKNATIIKDGNEVLIPVSDVKVGDLVILRPGEKAPVDGVVINGETEVNESMLTGESRPIKKQISDKVLCGSINYNGTIKIDTEKTGSETVISQIVEIVEKTQASKAPIQRTADKVARIFVPIIITLSLITFIAWFLTGTPFNTALTSAIAVMVIACPCALGLATPTAIIVSTGRAAKNGILIKKASSLEQAFKIDILAFDKTGTITHGMPEVTEILNLGDYTEETILEIISSCEKHSEHPVGKAISHYTNEKGVVFTDVKDFRAIPGFGIYAKFKEAPVFIGNEELMVKNSVYLKAFESKISKLKHRENNIVYFSSNGLLKAVVTISDNIRPTAKPAIDHIKSMGITPVMLSGDNLETTRLVAKKTGFNEFKSNLKPGEKIDELKKYRTQKNVVGMVGDGINDTPALAEADVSFAIGSGTDTAMETADITIANNDLTKVAYTIELSRETIKIIKQNLCWAFGYNSIAIPIAALGLLNPMIAAGAMALSSVSVVTNSLRLKNCKI